MATQVSGGLADLFLWGLTNLAGGEKETPVWNASPRVGLGGRYWVLVKTIPIPELGKLSPLELCEAPAIYLGHRIFTERDGDFCSCSDYAQSGRGLVKEWSLAYFGLKSTISYMALLLPPLFRSVGYRGSHGLCIALVGHVLPLAPGAFCGWSFVRTLVLWSGTSICNRALT